ncbi:MAG: Nif3-like dinuclear metal center hexameric protein [Bacteroidales bacterium]
MAYDIYNIENPLPGAGMGFTAGDLPGPMEQEVFLQFLMAKLELQGVRYAGTPGRVISRVAVCGGSGSSLVGHAKRAGADAYITGDIRYHSFFEAGNDILLVDIGHYESEKYSLEILYEIITKKFPKFAVRFSKINTNR